MRVFEVWRDCAGRTEGDRQLDCLLPAGVLRHLSEESMEVVIFAPATESVDVLVPLVGRGCFDKATTTCALWPCIWRWISFARRCEQPGSMRTAGRWQTMC